MSSQEKLKKKKHLGNQQNDVSEVASLQITRYQNRVHIKYSLLWFQGNWKYSGGVVCLTVSGTEI